MLDVDDILFPKKPIKLLNGPDVLFDVDINWELDIIKVDVSYYSLKENKQLKNDNIINSNEPLIGFGICDKTQMINVGYFEENTQIYFWVKPEEVVYNGTFTEEWEIDDARIYVKAIKEKWTTEKNTKD